MKRAEEPATVKKRRIEALSTRSAKDIEQSILENAGKDQGASQEELQSVVWNQHEELAKERVQEISPDFLAGLEAENTSFEKSTTS